MSKSFDLQASKLLMNLTRQNISLWDSYRNVSEHGLKLNFTEYLLSNPSAIEDIKAKPPHFFDQYEPLDEAKLTQLKTQFNESLVESCAIAA